MISPHTPPRALSQPIPLQVRPGKAHPNVADFHRAFEKSWQQCFLPRGHCDVVFGGSRVQTILKRGLVDLFPDDPLASAPLQPTATGSARAKRRRQVKTGQDVLGVMCAHDIVVFESGIEDFSLPLTRFSPLRDPSLLQPACSGRPVAECAAVLPLALQNKSWRGAPFAAYRHRLTALLNVSVAGRVCPWLNHLSLHPCKLLTLVT